MGALAFDFFKNALLVWFADALLLLAGLLIIAFHQYWSNAAAVIISLLGWILACCLWPLQRHTNLLPAPRWG
jgi:hypothetical protein